MEIRLEKVELLHWHIFLILGKLIRIFFQLAYLKRSLITVQSNLSASQPY
jgi:hypothetical protein